MPSLWKSLMRRADRLFQIVQLLRGRRLTTAQWLAERLEVSPRTIYRDVADLIGSGVPIAGEAGIGYLLRPGLDLPPLMFDAEELTAIDLGLRFAQAVADAGLSRAALSAMAKVRAVLPADRAKQADSHTFVPVTKNLREPNLAKVSAAIRAARKIRIRYQAPEAKPMARVIWPLALFYWGKSWTLVAWCETRNDFRSFRLDRIGRLTSLDAPIPDVKGRRLEDYMARMEQDYGVKRGEIDPLR